VPSPRHPKVAPIAAFASEQLAELTDALAKLADHGIGEHDLDRLLEIASERGKRTRQATTLRTRRHRAKLAKIVMRRRSDHAAFHKMLDLECPGLDKCATAAGFLAEDARATLTIERMKAVASLVVPIMWHVRDRHLGPEQPNKTSVGALLKRVGLTDKQCALLQLVHENGRGALPFTDEDIAAGTDAWKMARHARAKDTSATGSWLTKKSPSKKSPTKKTPAKKPPSST
jgi:hypothetical protein